MDNVALDKEAAGYHRLSSNFNAYLINVRKYIWPKNLRNPFSDL